MSLVECFVEFDARSCVVRWELAAEICLLFCKTNNARPEKSEAHSTEQ